ncbi:hypothetical protein LZ554_002227 [Drepanopeziza brunnea f. sp. 'monogermtubi']|nr:hypothetical protein LZ554_002227 [Drepanopeziza brunnea f. sp. 'monogermtubi']
MQCRHLSSPDLPATLRPAWRGVNQDSQPVVIGLRQQSKVDQAPWLLELKPIVEEFKLAARPAESVR